MTIERGNGRKTREGGRKKKRKILDNLSRLSPFSERQERKVLFRENFFMAELDLYRITACKSAWDKKEKAD